MTRGQCIVLRSAKILMVKHKTDRGEYWCLPGGAIEPGETPEHAALRELEEECGVTGESAQQLSYHAYGTSQLDEAYTFLVDIGTQVPRKGSDPELRDDNQILADVAWLSLRDIPERDRVFLYVSGLLGISEFSSEIEEWGDEVSYPNTRR